MALSARHVHLTQATIERLFGESYVLKGHVPLSQPGQFSACETVDLIGPRGRVDRVRVLGPPRAMDQVEISRTDARILGLEAPLRLSGDLDATPGITLEGPQGKVELSSGVVCALRHIQMSPADAARLNVRNHEIVEVAIDGDRPVVFGDVIVRVSPDYRLEFHLDTDEGNAAGVGPETVAYLTDALGSIDEALAERAVLVDRHGVIRSRTSGLEFSDSELVTTADSLFGGTVVSRRGDASELRR